MSYRDLVAQCRIRYDLETHMLEIIPDDFSNWEPLDLSNSSIDDISFLKANFNSDIIDELVEVSKKVRN